MASLVIKAHQTRSLSTQKKLLNALYVKLEDKFFEHISVKELASEAGVSVGTFYRRFKDKESLLPLLYQDFGQDLKFWSEVQEKRQHTDLTEAINVLVHETYLFMNEKKSVFRTLHLNARLHSDIVSSDPEVDRKAVYRNLAMTLAPFCSSPTCDVSNKTEFAVFILINSLVDKILYPDITPAVACRHNGDIFRKELVVLLTNYLSS
ncbi:TetR/AcrR family transcriptional regulator [Pseudoalteromonas piratica]|uniref:TetR/AcrR family transcriptional regulator n=1 Tax=Pseudoalteromonas piratica TaxID=1348114 RepID=UPI00068FF908|nr:TetR/AcrR family transcriptional regulator [Pseudoalteromonas piratica]